MQKAKRPIPEGFHTVTPQLTLDNAAQAIDWYKKALGATERSRATSPDGKVMHADLQIGDSHIMLNDAGFGGAKGPRAFGGSPASIWVYVDDCDTVYNKAISAGAKPLDRPMGKVADQFWGDRAGGFTDPSGYRWTVATHKEDLTPEEMKTRQAEFMKQMSSQPVAH